MNDLFFVIINLIKVLQVLTKDGSETQTILNVLKEKVELLFSEVKLQRSEVHSLTDYAADLVSRNVQLEHKLTEAKKNYSPVFFRLFPNSDKPPIDNVVPSIKALRTIVSISLRDANIEIDMLRDGKYTSRKHQLTYNLSLFEQRDALNILIKHFDICFIDVDN